MLQNKQFQEVSKLLNACFWYSKTKLKNLEKLWSDRKLKIFSQGKERVWKGNKQNKWLGYFGKGNPKIG